MKLDCILTAVDENILYLGFVPIFIKTWNKLYPSVDIRIVLIAENIPDDLKMYADNIILFEPLPDMYTAFISQYIRLLYPALLDYENGIMITDMDMLPMHTTYYTENIKNFNNDKFIYFGYKKSLQMNQIVMCYNVATNKIWKDIFQIKSLEDVKKRLIDVYSTIDYANVHGKSGWSTDQIDLYNKVIKWNANTGNFIVLKEKDTGYCRLDRHTFSLNEEMENKIKKEQYTDYHCYRPFKDWEKLNNRIHEILPMGN